MELYLIIFLIYSFKVLDNALSIILQEPVILEQDPKERCAHVYFPKNLLRPVLAILCNSRRDLLALGVL